MQDFRNLKVWQKSHALTVRTYQASAVFPRTELFGLTSQMRRSAYSVPMNIAEGCGRGSDADFARFLHMALGSASELEYQYVLARDLGYLEEANFAPLNQDIVEIKRMLAALIQTVKG